MADDKDAKDAKAEKEKLLKKDLTNIALAVKEIKPYASVINFHLHDPDPTKAAEIKDITKEHKGLANVLKKIDNPAGAAGPGALPEGPLSDNKLSALVNFDAKIESKQKEAFKEQFFGARIPAPPPAVPLAAGAAPPDPIFPFIPDDGSILRVAQDTLKDVKKNATVEVNRLLHAGDPVTPQEWSDAFQKPLKNFEADVDARIKMLEDQKFADVQAAYAPITQREYEIEKQAQIESLKNLKAEFRKEVEGLEKNLISTIKTATFEDERDPAHVAPLGEIARRGAVLPDALLNGGKPPVDPANPTADPNRTLFEHAEIVRVKRLLENKVSTVDKGRVWDSVELIDVTNVLSPGKYLIERSKWDFRARKEFEVTADGIIIHSGCNERDIGVMLDAFYVKTGKANGVIHISKDADVSVNFLKDIAKALEERRNPAPGRPPTTMKLDDETVKILMDPNGKHRFSQEEVTEIGRRLSNDNTWQPSAAAPSKSR